MSDEAKNEKMVRFVALLKEVRNFSEEIRKEMITDSRYSALLVSLTWVIEDIKNIIDYYE